jgi:hypothetical protein
MLRAKGVEDVKVHGGVSRLTVPMPARQDTPPESFGWQPAVMGA